MSTDGDSSASPPAADSDRDRSGPDPEREQRLARRIAVLFVLAAVLAMGLTAVYLAGGQTQVEGLLLFGAFGAVGIGLGLWVRGIVGSDEIVEPRYPMRSSDLEREAFEVELSEQLGETRPGGRRRFLVKLALGSSGVIGLSLLVPLRSLGPGPENELFETPWAAGRRLVTQDGDPILADDVVPDQVVTVFPEDAAGSADGQALVIGIRPERFDPSRLPAPTVDGIVCYSKICTHAGCPVGLYRARASQLLCPCHQSTFDVNEGAVPVSGPAARALPQLPLAVDEQGYLVASGEFTEPVGPSFWNLDAGPAGTDG